MNLLLLQRSFHNMSAIFAVTLDFLKKNYFSKIALNFCELSRKLVFTVLHPQLENQRRKEWKEEIRTDFVNNFVPSQIHSLTV